MFHTGIHEFALDKAAAAIYEGIALQKIEQWYESQGLRVHVRYNEANGLTDKRGFDLIDTYGKKWECKADRMWGTTGNIFLEHSAISHSEADYFIILAGLTYILPYEVVLQLACGPYKVVQGGDEMRATGTLVPLLELNNYIV